MITRIGWSRALLVVGGLAMLVGAVDPMEGSLLILPGSGLVALSSYLGRAERWLIAFKVSVFVMIAIGVGALFALSEIGGIGGPSGHSMWWGLLILPYLVGWTVGIWGPGSPRWMAWPGIAVGLWYVTLATVLLRNGPRTAEPLWTDPLIILAMLGLVTIVGCIYRLGRGWKSETHASALGGGSPS